MAEGISLELLSPELQLQIILHLDTPESLHALISASSRFYQVFRTNKESTLSTIARRQLPQSAAQDALAIEKVSQPGLPLLSRDSVLAFFDFTREERCKWQKSVLSLPISIKLCKLDKTIRFFITDYARNTIPIIDQLRVFEDFSIRKECWQNCHTPYFELSTDECKRLKRAFCRYETYRQLFSRCSSNLNYDLYHHCREPPLSIIEQGQLFFQHTPAYQVVEVACIRDYLFRRLRGIFDQVEDEAVRDLKAEFPNPTDKEQAMEWDSRTGGRYQYFDWDEGHYFTYSGKYYQDHHIEHLISLGLPYIRRIFESTGHERRDLLLRDACGCSIQGEKQFLTVALGLDLMTFGKRYGRLERGSSSCIDERSESALPPAWLWAHPRGNYLGLVDRSWKALRDWGYVFWDSERLRESGILERDPRDLRRIEFDELRASRGLSVQERWMGPAPDVSSSHYDDDYSDDYEPHDQEVEEGGGGEEVEEFGEVEEPESENDGTDQEEDEGEAKHTEDKDAIHTPSPTLSLVLIWFRRMANAVLRPLGFGLCKQS